MAALYGFDAFSPAGIAERVEQVGVAKARLRLPTLLMLGLLAGAFIGLGALYYAIVAGDPALPHAGFEHSVANMYFIPLGMMLQAAAGQPVELSGLARNLVPVIAGNLVGGGVLVGLVYYVIYRWPLRATSTLEPSRKASDG